MRSRNYRQTFGLALCLALLCQSLLAFAPAAAAQTRRTKKPRAKKTKKARVLPTLPAPRLVIPPTVAPQAETTPTPPVAAAGPVKLTAVSQVRVNFSQLSKQAQGAIRRAAAPEHREVHSPLSIPDAGQRRAAAGRAPLPQALQSPDVPDALAPSPAPSQNFLAQEDSPRAGTNNFAIPPDAAGAVGRDKVFVTLNNNYRVQNKATGAPLSTVSIDAFWASTGVALAFDPRVQFDPYQNRWLLTAVGNPPPLADSSLLLAVSDTADPQGSYTIYRFIIGCPANSPGCHAEGEWGDFPMLGFNKNWVAVSWNHFSNASFSFLGGRLAVFDYPALRAGTVDATLFPNLSFDHGFCMYPATTLSPDEETLYVPVHQSAADAQYRLHRVTGTPADPVFQIDPSTRVRPGGAWTFPGGENLPQKCVAGVGAPTQTCPATLRRIESQDSFVRSGPVFRNGKIYYAQSVALPAGSFPGDLNARHAVQWTALNPDGTFADGGRVEDATATLTNGGRHYSYPSLAVNKHGDLLLGFSEFESDDYADAGYALRLAGDPAGATREPVIYKEGEDYYSKTFSGTRNRWGDYSQTAVDPSNDRDLWTIQQYAALRVGATGNDTHGSRWGTWWAKVSVPAGAGDLLISEFRLRGPNGANDEFVEVYNNTGSSHTVRTADGSAGYAVVAQDNLVRCTIPAGTVIPARGHYLCVNSVGYSLAAHPAGNGTTAAGDATYTLDIPDNSGLAVFRTATPAEFNAGHRLDAVGFTTTPPSAYVEGAGLPALTNPLADHSFYRDNCGKGGSLTALGPCPAGGLHKDTDNNAADFVYVASNGSSAGAGQRLGAPGPENLSSPVVSAPGQFSFLLLDATAGGSAPPNRARDLASDPAQNSTFGTLEIRRRVTNNTGAPVTRLRFRIADITTFPPSPTFADLRARTSTPFVVTGVNDPATCAPAAAPCNVTVQGTTLEQPPSQPNGGGFNSSMSAGTVTLAAPLAPGASVNVRFLLGVQQTGNFKFVINLEALP
jgi:hypothetical protein